MLVRLSDMVHEHRRRVVVLVLLVAMLGAAGAAAGLFDRMKGGGFSDPGSESARAAEYLEDTFGHTPPNLVLLVDADGPVDAASGAGTALTERLAAENHVTDVMSYWTTGAEQLRSADGTQALILATITGDETTVETRSGEIADAFAGDVDGLEVAVGGYGMIQHEMVEQSTHDAMIGEAIAFPVALIALVLVFGSLVAAALPLVVAAVTLVTTLGLLTVVSFATDLSVFAVNAVTLLGLGLAIDYSLLVVNRYREEIKAGAGTAAALRTTMRSAGRTVLFSAVTVVIALSVMVWFPMMALRSMAYAGIAVALVAALASVTLLPALLLVAGRRVLRRRDRLMTPDAPSPDSPAATDPVPAAGFWHRTASLVMRRPIPVATVVVGVLLALGTPFLDIELAGPDERALPAESVSRQVSETIAADFPGGSQETLPVVVPQVDGDLATYAADLSALDGVERVDGPDGTFVGGEVVEPAGVRHRGFVAGDAAYLNVVPTGTADLDDLVVDVRSAPSPGESLVGGTAADSRDIADVLADRLPEAAITLGLAMLVLLFLLTGSVFVPVVAVVLSLLSLTAALGALVWVFQEGNLSDLLGFTVTGTLIATIPVMLFAIAFGLAMDYQVFLLSRIREEYDRTGDPREAVAVGLERVGRIVTAAAVLISLVFLGFLVSDITFVMAFGIGLPLAMIVDATLIRGALLPAVMRMGGRATWWAPAPLRRLHRRFGISESGPAPARELVDA